jgi:hypothetical protein
MAEDYNRYLNYYIEALGADEKIATPIEGGGPFNLTEYQLGLVDISKNIKLTPMNAETMAYFFDSSGKTIYSLEDGGSTYIDSEAAPDLSRASKVLGVSEETLKNLQSVFDAESWDGTEEPDDVFKPAVGMFLHRMNYRVHAITYKDLVARRFTARFAYDRRLLPLKVGDEFEQGGVKLKLRKISAKNYYFRPAKDDLATRQLIKGMAR